MFAEYSAVALASTLKFIGGPLTGAALGLSWWETALCSTAGLMGTVVILSLFGDAIEVVLRRRRSHRPRRFSRRTRLAVRLHRRTGVVGIALLTPLLFSPPFGTAIALSFKAKKRHLFPAMLASGLLWGVVLSLLVRAVPGLFGA